MEWRPEFQFALRTGARVIGEGESISENTNTYGFLEFVVNYGNPWDVDRHKPYDRFDVASQVNFGDKTNIGRLLIRGDLFTKPLGDGRRHLLTLQQDFDYINNEAYEYGGQSLGTALLSRFTPSPKLTLYSRVQAYAIILGAVNSDYSQLADVAEQERIREYDYGPGVGGAVELYLQRKNLPLVTARYRYSYINVSNGSVYNGTYEGYNVGLEVGPRHPSGQPEAGDPAWPVADDRRGRLGLLAPQPLQRHGRHARVRATSAPDDHPEEPRAPGVRGLELQPLSPEWLDPTEESRCSRTGPGLVVFSASSPRS